MKSFRTIKESILETCLLNGFEKENTIMNVENDSKDRILFPLSIIWTLSKRNILNKITKIFNLSFYITISK